MKACSLPAEKNSDSVASGPIAHQFPLTPEQTHRQSASDLHQEEQDSRDPSLRRDRDTILRSAHFVKITWFSQIVIKYRDEYPDLISNKEIRSVPPNRPMNTE